MVLGSPWRRPNLPYSLLRPPLLKVPTWWWIHRLHPLCLRLQTTGSPSTSAPSYTSRRLLPVAPPFVPSSSSEPEYPLQGPVPEAPDSLPTVVPAQVLVLGRRLGSCENLSGEDRIRRAWKAGREAAEVLEGRKSRPEASPRLPLTNRVYCILRVTDLVCPRVVHSFSEYKAFPGILSDPRSVSHAFPSDSEARAFFAGASLPYPQ